MNIDYSKAPASIARLPRDSRGYAIPWFVKLYPHGPDFRVIAEGKIQRAVSGNRCWVCGERLGRYLAAVVGPMCVVNRVTAEPPSHRECAIFSAQHCPFLSIPRMHRQHHNMPEHIAPPGVMIERNPGVCAVYIMRDYAPISGRQMGVGNPGTLFALGEPTEVLWFAQGRAATHEEVEQSISAGLPALLEVAQRQGNAAVEALEDLLTIARRLVPA
jgi:hypothetical protein